MNTAALHLTILHQIAGRRQGRQTDPNEMGGLFLHPLRLAWPCKSLIVAACVIHNKNASSPVCLNMSLATTVYAKQVGNATYKALAALCFSVSSKKLKFF